MAVGNVSYAADDWRPVDAGGRTANQVVPGSSLSAMASGRVNAFQPGRSVLGCVVRRPAAVGWIRTSAGVAVPVSFDGVTERHLDQAAR